MSTRLLRSAGSTPDIVMPDTAPTHVETCMICLETIDPNDPISRLDCNHGFHATCLVPALTRDPRCPCCRFFPRDFVHPDELDNDEPVYDSEDVAPLGPARFVLILQSTTTTNSLGSGVLVLPLSLQLLE